MKYLKKLVFWLLFLTLQDDGYFGKGIYFSTYVLYTLPYFAYVPEFVIKEFTRKFAKVFSFSYTFLGKKNNQRSLYHLFYQVIPTLSLKIPTTPTAGVGMFAFFSSSFFVFLFQDYEFEFWFYEHQATVV